MYQAVSVWALILLLVPVATYAQGESPHPRQARHLRGTS